MITLPALADLVSQFRGSFDRPITPLRIGEREFDVDRRPVIMGTVNLSRDSTYRESIAVSEESAIRKARVMATQGADVVDIGAESSTARAERVSPDAQVAALAPVISALAADGVIVSVETYEPSVVRACLAAGAQVLNMTGIEHEDAMLDLAAEHRATVILCSSAGANVREITDVPLDADSIPMLLEHFSSRIDHAATRGVDRIVIDPGMGFYYGNLTDPITRARHQARVLLQGFRLRELGVPVCNALPHAFDLFEDQFRTAEGFYAVLARLGGTGILRTHEVAHVRAVLTAVNELDVD